MQMGRQSSSPVLTAPSSAASGSDVRGGFASDHRVSVFLEHNLVSVLILAAAFTGAWMVISKLATLGPWWARTTQAMARVTSR